MAYSFSQSKVTKPRKKKAATYNTTGNKRAGQAYTTTYTSKGAVHEYASGESVLVKKKKNPSRKLTG